jgi:hypothetical protein
MRSSAAGAGATQVVVAPHVASPCGTIGGDLAEPAPADRADLIGRLHQREDAARLAELLMDLEEDEPARLRLVGAISLGYSTSPFLEVLQQRGE